MADYPLGVDAFIQSGTRNALYQYNHIDAEAIAAAAFDVLDNSGSHLF